MRRAELSLAYLVAEPLIDELAVLAEMNDPRGPHVIGGVIGLGVVRALVRVTFADIDVAVWRERHHQRLPEKTLSFRVVPIATTPACADGQKQFAVGTDLHDRRAVGGRD